IPASETTPYAKTDCQKAKQLIRPAGSATGCDPAFVLGGAWLIPGIGDGIWPPLETIAVNGPTNRSYRPTWISQYLIPKNYQLTITSIIDNVTPTNNFLYYHSKGAGTGNLENYANATADGLIDKQNAELDLAKRKQYVLDAQRTLLADWAPCVPLGS